MGLRVVFMRRSIDKNTGLKLGSLLKRLRVEAKLSQAELARRAGLSSGYTGLLERGLRNPSLSVMCSISEVLGVELYVWFGDGEKSPRSPEFRALFESAPSYMRQAVLEVLESAVRIQAQGSTEN